VKRATGPADLLALVPTLFGFHPHDSVVLIATDRDVCGFSARVDLPRGREAAEGLADYLAAATLHQGARRVALVLYSDDAGLCATAADVLVGGLEERGVEVRTCLRADGRRWFGLRGPCPSDDGVPYDVGSHAWTAEAVVAGRVTFASREELAASLVGTDPDDEGAVLASADAAALRLLGSADGPGLATEARWVRRAVRRATTTGERPGVEDAARLLVAVASIQVRDVAWAQMSRENARAHVELWRDLTRRAPEQLRPPAAGLLAFAAWLSGDGALAWCAVDRCHETDPGYTLANLVAQALEGAVPPSTWTPFDDATLPVFAG